MRPPFAVAGIWRPWTGIRGTKAALEEGNLNDTLIPASRDDLVEALAYGLRFDEREGAPAGGGQHGADRRRRWRGISTKPASWS